MKACLFPIIMWLCLLTSCRSTHKVTSTNTFATDSAVQVQRHQWQTSRIDSVWRHTELLFDSCIVSFGVGAETPTIEAPHALQGASNAKAQKTFRQKPQSIRIYGAHLSSSRKESTKTEAREEDSLAATRQSSLQQVQQGGVHGETMDFSCQVNLDLGIPCSLGCLLVVPSSGLRCLNFFNGLNTFS